MNLKSKKGFTLVELIIVIAILGIIALIAVPSLTGVQKRSQVNADIRTAEQIGKAVRVWLTDGNINQQRDREAYLKGKYVELDQFTEANVDGQENATTTNNGLEDYIALTYEPNVTNSSGTELNFYVGLINNKVAVGIANSSAVPTNSTATVYEFGAASADADPEVIEGIAYVEGISTLTEDNIKAALAIE